MLPDFTSKTLHDEKKALPYFWVQYQPHQNISHESKVPAESRADPELGCTFVYEGEGAKHASSFSAAVVLSCITGADDSGFQTPPAGTTVFLL